MSTKHISELHLIILYFREVEASLVNNKLGYFILKKDVKCYFKHKVSVYIIQFLNYKSCCRLYQLLYKYFKKMGTMAGYDLKEKVEEKVFEDDLKY